MKVGIITLFPEIFSPLNSGVIGRAVTNKIVDLHYWNPRDFALDNHRTVDDRPYGGGPGMLMKVEPLREAITAAKKQIEGAHVIYVSPQGKLFNQSAAKEMSTRQSMIFVAGRYEGIDERLLKTVIDEEWSIGDYVVSGGELPIMVMLDAIIRLLPGVLGDEQSAEQDSFMEGLLDCPHYTRPEMIDGLKVPEVLLQGDHAKIARWRLKQMLGRTYLRRPDLLNRLKLDKVRDQLLKEFINEYQ